MKPGPGPSFLVLAGPVERAAKFAAPRHLPFTDAVDPRHPGITEAETVAAQNLRRAVDRASHGRPRPRIPAAPARAARDPRVCRKKRNDARPVARRAVAGHRRRASAARAFSDALPRATRGRRGRHRSWTG